MGRCVQKATRGLKELLHPLRSQRLERQHMCVYVQLRMQAVMTVLKVFLLLQGLLLAAWGDIWPADQELKDGEDDQFKHTTHQKQDGWDHQDPHGDFGTGHHSGEAQKESTESSGTVHYPLEHGHVKPSHEHSSEDLSEAEGGSTEGHGNKTLTRMG